MDPAGIREIYCLRPYVDNPYQLELVSGALPFKTRVHATHMNIPWLPLSEPLTQRVSTASEGYAGWLQYDAAVIAGVDLECVTERDVQHLKSALERGLPLLLCGGQFGLGRSYRLWHDLEDALPAAIPVANPVECTAEVVAVGSHPILRGLPNTFGKVKTVHPIKLHNDAQALLTANGLPVLAASERFGGRQLILTVSEADGLCCDALSTEGFHGHPFYGDLMRQCLTWLMAVEAPLAFDSLTLETGLFHEGAGPHVIHVGARRSGDAPGALLRCLAFALDEARLASGGDTRRAERLSEFTRPLTDAAQTETFLIEDTLAGKCSGVYEVELALEMARPPRTSPKGCFGMAQPPEWNNWKGNAVCIRRFFLRFADRRTARLFVPGRTFTLEESKTWRVKVFPQSPASCRLQVADSTGAVVGTVSSGQADSHELLWPVPPLVEGDYTAKVFVERPGAQVEEFQFLLKAVAPRPPDDDFRMISHTAAGILNDDETLALMRTNLAEFGLDTLSLGILRLAEKVWDESTRWADEPFGLRRARWLDAMAVSEGLHLWNDFDQQMIILATHGANARYAPTTPCVVRPHLRGSRPAETPVGAETPR